MAKYASRELLVDLNELGAGLFGIDDRLPPFLCIARDHGSRPSAFHDVGPLIGRFGFARVHTSGRLARIGDAVDQPAPDRHAWTKQLSALDLAAHLGYFRQIAHDSQPRDAVSKEERKVLGAV